MLRPQLVVVDKRVERDLWFLDLENSDGMLYVDCNVDKLDKGFLWW